MRSILSSSFGNSSTLHCEFSRLLEDLGIQGEAKPEYGAVSDELFSQISRTICIATSASAPIV